MIKGGVDCYCVDLRGEKHPVVNADIWRETFVVGIVRCIMDTSDDALENDEKPILGLRKMDPIPTIASERRFLEAAAQEFWKGWQVGSDPTVQSSSHCSNHLTDGITKYFYNSGRIREATKFFKSLYTENSEIAAVLAKTLIDTDEEAEAVFFTNCKAKVMYDASKIHPIPYELLIVESEFLMKKKQFQNALKLAKLAVARAPTEYRVWAHMAGVYIEIEDYESALLALNSCPMFTFHEKGMIITHF